ncbi:VanZ like family protein [Halolactibacillus halophilus]|uniref:VanZ family protein n=1 Tax=Halolactibacillus halophilus TaxID=306540 RepID=A0A1I5QC08_9BACI|nr:VanZ family protein [Halolactibacillus halophilus]GEM01730.1 VanZ family protein [Halolactibacillus halophilus]SFP43637.1 VanZ like family protein [Halolactibacillus halophilus]
MLHQYQKTRLKQLLIWSLPVIWMGLIFLFSATPYERQDLKPALTARFDLSVVEPLVDWVNFTYHNSEISVASLGIESFVEFFIRKGAHVFVFFILTLLFIHAFKKTTRLDCQRLLLFSYLMSVVYAGFDEWHQSLTPNRTPYIGDVLLDSVGSFLAVLGIVIIAFLRQRR